MLHLNSSIIDLTFKENFNIVAYTKVIYTTIIQKGDYLKEDFEKCIGLQLKLTKNIMESEYNKYLKEFGISNEQGLLLKLVYEMPGCTQTQLAEFLHKDKTTITRMIDTLVKKEKLMRTIAKEDRRIHKIYVTKNTSQKVKEISPIFEKREEELREIIGEENYEITLKVLNQIKKYYRGLNR